MRYLIVMDAGDIELEIENIFLEIANLGSVHTLRVITFIEEKLMLLKRELSSWGTSIEPICGPQREVEDNHFKDAGKVESTSNDITERRIEQDSYNKGFQCMNCDKVLSSRFKLKQHRSNPENCTRFLAKVRGNNKCPDCGFMSVNERNLKSHMIIHQAKYVCNNCSHTFRNKQFLLQHTSNIRNCQKYLKSKLEKEIKTDPKDKPKPISKDQLSENQFSCGLCDWKSHIRKALSEHLAKHSGKYKCYTCGQCFGRKAVLETHLSDPENCIKVIKSLDSSKESKGSNVMVQIKLETVSSDFESQEIKKELDY